MIEEEKNITNRNVDMQEDKKSNKGLGVLVHAYNPSTGETEAGR
jgi:hypothetical protein